jgi:hypothetical protein
MCRLPFGRPQIFRNGAPQSFRNRQISYEKGTMPKEIGHLSLQPAPVQAKRGPSTKEIVRVPDEQGPRVDEKGPWHDEKGPIPDENVSCLDIIGPFPSRHGPFRSRTVTFSSIIVRALAFPLPLLRSIEPEPCGYSRHDEQSGPSILLRCDFSDIRRPRRRPRAVKLPAPSRLRQGQAAVQGRGDTCPRRHPRGYQDADVDGSPRGSPP